MEITQGKLIIGLDVNILDKDARYKIMIYNSLLGGSANSKLFQNVREKASLAYTASSSYYRFKNNIFIFQNKTKSNSYNRNTYSRANVHSRKNIWKQDNIHRNFCK